MVLLYEIWCLILLHFILLFDFYSFFLRVLLHFGIGAWCWCCLVLLFIKCFFFSLEFWRECKTITICRSHLYMSSHCTHLFSHKHRNVHRPKCRIALNRKKNEFNIDVCRCSRCTFKHTNSSVSV